MTTKQEIEDLKKACMLLQKQINALKTITQGLELNKEDKKPEKKTTKIYTLDNSKPRFS